MAFVDIELDLQILICALLRPSDILTLRKTCKTLQLVTRQRIIWVDALRRLCLENRLFLPSFPILDMSDVELEHAATAPRRWIEVSTSCALQEISDWEEGLFGTTRLSPTATRIVNSPFECIDNLILVPGGRYMVVHSQNGLAVWDVGYISSADCKLIAFNVEPNYYSSTFKVHPTPDGMGLVIFLVHQYKHCSIYEIYPQSEIPQFTKIASRDLHFVDGYHDYVSVDKVIWYSLHFHQTVFRVWDYRLNASVSFATLANVKAKDGSEVIATQTAIVMLDEKEILIWAIPPLSPQSLDFDDYNLTEFQPVIKILWPDFPSPHFTGLATWNTMSIWYTDPSKPLYFDKIYDSGGDGPEVQRFKIIFKPNLSGATLHYINTLQLATFSEHEIPFQSMFCEDIPLYSWSASDLGSCTGSTLACNGPLLRPPFCHPSTGTIWVALPPDGGPCSAASICSASGRIVTGSTKTNEIIVYDFLPHQRRV